MPPLHRKVLAFPDLFPSGEGAYNSHTERVRDLHIRKYFQQRLLNVDGRFAKNIEYIFCTQHISDIKQIQGDANLAIKITWSHIRWENSHSWDIT